MICASCREDRHETCGPIADFDGHGHYRDCDCFCDSSLMATVSKAKAHALRGVVLLGDYDKSGAAGAFRRALAELNLAPRGSARLRLVNGGITQ